MKTLGLIGGTSWISTADYYKYINEGVNQQLGGVEFAHCIIYSFNYADIKKYTDINDWDTILKMLVQAGNHLKRSGATAIVLCANTMHLLADKVEQALDLPLIHVATATAYEIKNRGVQKVGLLGTKYTMEQNFFKDKLSEQGIETIIPDTADREFIHRSIYQELAKNIIRHETKQRYLDIMEKLTDDGAEGIILGCTEIPLLIKPGDVNIPTFDTTLIHSMAAVEYALG